MKQEANCPQCNYSITVWQVMKAPTPLNLRCQGCGVRMHVEGWNWHLTAGAVIIGFFLGVMLVSLFIMTKMPIALLMGILLALVVLTEILFSLFVINRGTFIIPKRRAADRAAPMVAEGQKEEPDSGRS